MNVKLTILGCGSSMGVPRIDGNWGMCDPKEKKNYRTRCSALLKTKNLNVLIDTSPDLRAQLIGQKVKKIDRVIYTHMHADQTHGINDLRLFYLKQQKRINVYADKLTKKYLLQNFSYCFKDENDYPAILNLKDIKKELILIDQKEKLRIKCIPVNHGLIEAMAIIINNKCAYVSDAKEIYKDDLKKFYKLDYFIIDCLRINKHPTHYSLNEVLDLIKFIKPKKTILTNLNNDLDYNYLLHNLPKNVIPAYDGLTINL